MSGLGGNRVRADDGSVELQFALRNVALRALVVGNLRQVDVVLAGGEVHVVVAGTASRAAGIRQPVIGLRGAGYLDIFVAECAAPRIGRKNHRGPVGYRLIEADDLVGLAGNARWEAGCPCGSCERIPSCPAVLPVSGSTVCGWWHMMQRSMPMREPPWNDSESWHLLQLAVRTTSRVLVGVPPAGIKVSVLEA